MLCINAVDLYIASGAKIMSPYVFNVNPWLINQNDDKEERHMKWERKRLYCSQHEHDSAYYCLKLSYWIVSLKRNRLRNEATAKLKQKNWEKKHYTLNAQAHMSFNLVSWPFRIKIINWQQMSGMDMWIWTAYTIVVYSIIQLIEIGRYENRKYRAGTPGEEVISNPCIDKCQNQIKYMAEWHTI